MHFDFDTLLDPNSHYLGPTDAGSTAEDAAWLVIETYGWVPIPQLLFALKQQILEQMAGG
jgi:hypothetical protein